MWLSEKEKIVKAATRERLKKDAESLLALVVEELRARGKSATIEPGNPMRPGRCRIKVDEFVIPLTVEQRRRRSGYSSYEEDRLDVSCDWVWDGKCVLLKSKTFGYSPRRNESFGFDVKAIANHIGNWIGNAAKAEAQRKLREEAIESWDSVRERLISKGAREDQVRATAKGIELELPPLDERTAALILELINPDFQA